jgi:hypothetical protein
MMDEPDKVDCGSCYGNGCVFCDYTGQFETKSGRERREEWEDGAYDRDRDARMMGEKE